MKRFRFPLRPVGVLRAHQEMQAREIFAAAVHVYVESEEVLAAARARTAALESALRTGRADSYRAAEAATLLAAYRCECAAELDSERRVISARAEMERCRANYIAAHRRLRGVQRLEEKARGVHRVETLRAEQAEFDDFAGRRLAAPVS